MPHIYACSSFWLVVVHMLSFVSMKTQLTETTSARRLASQSQQKKYSPTTPKKKTQTVDITIPCPWPQLEFIPEVPFFGLYLKTLPVRLVNSRVSFRVDITREDCRREVSIQSRGNHLKLQNVYNSMSFKHGRFSSVW